MPRLMDDVYDVFFFQAEDGIRDKLVTGVQTCALPISVDREPERGEPRIRRKDRSDGHASVIQLRAATVPASDERYKKTQCEEGAARHKQQRISLRPKCRSRRYLWRSCAPHAARTASRNR